MASQLFFPIFSKHLLWVRHFMNSITSIPYSIPGISAILISASQNRWRIGFGLYLIACRILAWDTCVVAGVRAAILDHEVKISTEGGREIS